MPCFTRPRETRCSPATGPGRRRWCGASLRRNLEAPPELKSKIKETGLEGSGGTWRPLFPVGALYPLHSLCQERRDLVLKCDHLPETDRH